MRWRGKRPLFRVRRCTPALHLAKLNLASLLRNQSACVSVRVFACVRVCAVSVCACVCVYVCVCVFDVCLLCMWVSFFAYLCVHANGFAVCLPLGVCVFWSVFLVALAATQCITLHHTAPYSVSIYLCLCLPLDTNVHQCTNGIRKNHDLLIVSWFPSITMHTHTYMCLHIHMHICIYMSVNVFTWVYMDLFIISWFPIAASEKSHVFEKKNKAVNFLGVNLYVYVYMYIRTYMYIHTYRYIHINMWTHTRTTVHKYAYTYVYLYTYTTTFLSIHVCR